MSSAPEYVMGTQGFAGAWNDENIAELIEHLEAANIKHYDTARLYPITDSGASERLLGRVRKPDFIIDTKILYKPEGLLRENMRDSFNKSIEALGVTSVNTLYAHAPDKATPITQQAANFDELYREGSFKHMGLCNYSPKEIIEWIEIAMEKGYVQPTIYQGQYSIFCRHYEKELFPLLRKHGITFVANSPLAGGFATGKLTLAENDEKLKGTRFEQVEGNLMGYLYRMWFDKPLFHHAVRELIAIGERFGISSLSQIAMRWLLFHSGLKSTDSVAIGPTSTAQLKYYLAARDAGSLPDEMAVEINNLYGPLRDEATGMVEFGWWS
ncbi:Aldo/keto reductase [Penicillium angulare]|uniref:Aldo/keto reductase n=1 Tax=Penicillium angulare TaxID=116970 RepID=UPI0025423900|nr:Aldo/keto reductase [Penicillium angulare]KAJ5288894.1 Aldo/keto reductase [Penicillium angulare]